MSSAYLIEGLAEIGEDVFCVLDAYGEADEVGGYTGFAQLLVAELAMSVAGGVQHAGAGIGHMGNDGDHLQRIHKLDSCLAVALQSEGQHAARAVRQVLLRQGVTLVGG